MSLPSANENAFLGAIVGVAIGDALGLPVDGKSAEDIANTHGAFGEYLELEGMPEGQLTKGIISDKTEILLSFIESLTTNEAEIDPENIIARLRFVIDSPSRAWISDDVVRGVEAAFENEGSVPEAHQSSPEASILVRGVAIGLLHSIGEHDRDMLLADSMRAARLTHGDDLSTKLVMQVAEATAYAARFVDQDVDWAEELTVTVDHPLSDAVAGIVERVRTAPTFEDAVLPVVHAGGEAAALGAVAGGIAGAHFGAAGLPQEFIDDLDARIYLSMAAPWFYRSVLRRHGVVVNLHMTDQFPG